MKRVSLKDIAAMVGVSTSTVSFVLNGKGSQMRISEALEKKIKSVAEKAGYHPNQVAVSLRTGQSKILGLIVESIGGHFFAALAKIIEEEADRYGYRVIYCSTENNTRKGADMIRMLSQSQVDGYLITPTVGMEKDIADLNIHHRPVVLMDSYFPGVKVPYVTVDNFGGITMAMQHLYDRGYRRIGFVTVDLDLVQVKQRELSYLQFVKEKKLPVTKKQIFKLEYNYDKQEAIEKLTRFIKNNPDLKALVFATNYLGITGLQSIRNLHLKVPEDIAIVCFDDHDIFALYPPGITSVSQPVEQIAKTAMHLLMEQLTNKSSPTEKKQIELRPVFIERGST
jgi:LacI family transcriptional regulator